MSKAPRLDALNITGISSLINRQNIKNDIDLESIEKSIMNKSESTDKKQEPVNNYSNEINELAEQLGIDLSIDTPAKKTQVVEKKQSVKSKSSSGSSKSSSSGSHSSSSGSHSSSSGSHSSSSGSHSSSSGSHSSSEYSSDESSSVNSSVISNFENKHGIKTDKKYYEKRRKLGRHSYEDETEEQQKRRHVNSIIDDIRGETKTSFGVERERVQEIKESKLEQIGQLKLALEDDEVDCSGISSLNAESSMSEIDSVLSLLRLKNDRNRYSTVASEVITGLAEGIEMVFDGTRNIPLTNIRPDYTGYHNTVATKLHRMRFETSQVVGNIIEKYNIGASSRILLELLPSFFIYPWDRKRQKSSPGLANDFEINDSRNAMNVLRESEEKKNLDNI